MAGQNASYTNGTVYVWYDSSSNFWLCTYGLGDGTPLHASNGTGNDPWKVADGWSGVTCSRDVIFSVTGFSKYAEGANGDYLQTANTVGKTGTYAVYTNGPYYFFARSQFLDGSWWCVSSKAGDDKNAVSYSLGFSLNPWENTSYLTYLWNFDILTFTIGEDDITENGFVVTGVTSPASLNGAYSLTSGDISDLSSCQWTNAHGGHLKYFSGGYWIFGDSTNTANTPSDCYYWGQGTDKKPWEITSWSDGQYSHSGTLVLTVGGSSGGSGTPLFNVSGLTTTSANGDYWLTNEGATGYDRVFTNGVAYCIGHTELYDPSVPEAGYQIVQWMICEGDSYANKGTIYAMTDSYQSLTSDPWDCYFVDDMTGSGITITKIESESGGGGDNGGHSEPLTLTAEQANSTVKLMAAGSPTTYGLQYRTDSSDTWMDYTIDTVITLAKVGDYVQFKNTENTLSTSYSDCVYFVMSGKIAASGNIQSMLNWSDSCSEYCYRRMFDGCTSLTQAPELPATKLADHCYGNMFFNCTSLTKAPELPAT